MFFTSPLPVTLGVKNTPLDLTRWDAHCLNKIGRKVNMGEKLTNQEWGELGYLEAARELGRPYSFKRNREE